jgi:ribonuclease III
MDPVEAHEKEIRMFMARPPFCYRGLTDREVALIRTALTHDSFTNEMADAEPSRRFQSYERLEFLGDSVLEFLACERVYKGTDLEEGKMTDFKQAVVANHEISQRLLESGPDIDPMILVGNGHRDRHGNPVINENMRADSFEALLAAIYLIRGMDEARRVADAVLLDPADCPSSPIQD